MADKKTQWPECVGMTKEDAAAKIKTDRPDVLEVAFLLPISPATADYREDRVRIIHGSDGKVVAAPCIG